MYQSNESDAYRVSIKTESGWKSYGLFSDIDTAAYIANIAILAESCEDKYELNLNIGAKNEKELRAWRNNENNRILEDIARSKYAAIRDQIAELKKAEEREKSRLAESAHWERIYQQVELERANKTRQDQIDRQQEILAMNNRDLVAFINSINVYDRFYDFAMSEAVKRFNKLGLKRAT